MQYLPFVFVALLLLAGYSVYIVEEGHWFRENYWIAHQITLLIIGIVYANPFIGLIAVPIFSHEYWVWKSRVYGSSYAVWKDGFWMVDVPLTVIYLLWSLYFTHFDHATRRGLLI